MIRAALLTLALALAAPSVADAGAVRCDRFGCGTTLQKQWKDNVSTLSRRGVRPRGCPSLWCACWLAIKRLGLNPRESKRRGLWRARAWARLGRHISRPVPGAIAVFRRGRRGGHVGIVTAVHGRGKIRLLSGNDGGRVRNRVRSTRRVIAYVVLR